MHDFTRPTHYKTPHGPATRQRKTRMRGVDSSISDSRPEEYSTFLKHKIRKNPAIRRKTSTPKYAGLRKECIDLLREAAERRDKEHYQYYKGPPSMMNRLFTKRRKKKGKRFTL